MEFVRQISVKLKTSSNEGFLMKVFSHSLMWLSKHYSGHYVTTQACTLISWSCVHLRWCGSLEDYTLCNQQQVRRFVSAHSRWRPWGFTTAVTGETCSVLEVLKQTIRPVSVTVVGSSIIWGVAPLFNQNKEYMNYVCYLQEWHCRCRCQQ